MVVGSAQQEKPVEMEARIARLESDVAHLRTDVADIKADLRTRFDRVDLRIDALKDDLSSTKVRALILYITTYVTLATGTFGTMARAFGWI